MRIEGWAEKTVRLALARGAHIAIGRACEILGQGGSEDDPEYIAEVAVGNALIAVAASISEANETGILPDPYPRREVNDELAPGTAPQQG
jgi:hypothetical protein